MEFDCLGTLARPSWMRLFVVSNNGLYHRVALEDDALIVRVLTTNRLPLERIDAVSSKEEFITGWTVVTVTCDGWDYLVKFTVPGDGERFERILTEAIRVKKAG